MFVQNKIIFGKNNDRGCVEINLFFAEKRHGHFKKTSYIF